MEKRSEREPLLSEPTWKYTKRLAPSTRPADSVKFYRIDGPGEVTLYVEHEADVDRRITELNDALMAGWNKAKQQVEKLITDGTLRVVETTVIEEMNTSDGVYYECRSCGAFHGSRLDIKVGEFCRCGSQVID